MTQWKKLILLISLVFSGHLSAVEIGKIAPNFSLKNHDGATVSLSDFKGKNVVLEWYNQDCPFVRKFYNPENMQAQQKDKSGKDVVWLTIVSSAPGQQGYLDQKEALERRKIEKMNSQHLLLDSEGTVGKMYEAKTTPHMYIINSEGTLVYNGAIDSIRSAHSEDIPKATNYVAQAVNEILSGRAVSQAKTPPYGCSVKYKN